MSPLNNFQSLKEPVVLIKSQAYPVEAKVIGGVISGSIIEIG
jgi:hypothetical protein